MKETNIGLSTQTLVSGNSASQVPQYIAALCATIGGFVMGTILGWTSPTLIPLTEKEEYFPINASQFSLIGGLAPIGAMAGSLVTGVISDKIGRRWTMIGLLIPSCIGWALLIWATNLAMMYVGRFVLGVVAGATSVVCPLYTTEIAQIEIRGSLGTYFQLLVTIGILFTYLLGWIEVRVYWLSVICAIFPFIFSALMLIMPESPHYYLENGKTEEAKKSLQWLRGKRYDINQEIDVMKQNIQQAKENKVSPLKAFTSRVAVKGLIIGLATMFFQQFSGINAVVFYTSSIFQSAGSSLPPRVSTFIVGAVMVVATFVSTFIIDRLGRKPLLFGSDLIMAISTCILGVYFYLKHDQVDVSNIAWLPILCITVFIIVFSLGYGPIPWMFMSEIFPPEIKGIACSVASLFNWLCAFIVTFFFDSVNNAVGNYSTFWGFTVISAVGAAFVALVVPETKGRSLEEIQRIIAGK